VTVAGADTASVELLSSTFPFFTLTSTIPASESRAS